MGGVAFEITPLGLVGDRLNLGAWHGFQEVWYRPLLVPKQINFDLELGENSHGYFLFDKTSQGFRGLRLSRNPKIATMFFRADPQGAFLERHSLPQIQIEAGPQSYEAQFSHEGLRVLGPQGEVVQLDGDYQYPQGIGFRGGAADLWLDNIYLVHADGRQYFETFSNSSSLWPVWLLIWLGLVILNGILYFWRRNFYSNLTFNFMLLCIVIPMDLTNRFFLTHRYEAAKLHFKAVTKWGDYESNIETKSEALERLRREYPLEPRASGPRLLFVGTSQTWGAGVSQRSDSFVPRLERSGQIGGGRANSVQIINAGISGEKAGSLLKIFQEEWIKWQPDGVLLNLSNNDQDSEIFRRDMEAWLKFLKQRDIPTVLILEPNNPEQIRDNLLPNHEILRELSKAHGVPLIDLHACLAKDNDEGFMWWDFVHLTTWGHKMAQACLEPSLRNAWQPH